MNQRRVARAVWEFNGLSATLYVRTGHKSTRAVSVNMYDCLCTLGWSGAGNPLQLTTTFKTIAIQLHLSAGVSVQSPAISHLGH